MKTYKIFIDTEFTHLGKDPDLLSIGMITETGETFYGEVTNFATAKFNKNKDFLIKYVIPNLKYIKYAKSLNTVHTTKTVLQDPLIEDNMDLLCNSVTIKKAVNNWLGRLIKKYHNPDDEFMIEFVSDCAAYDSILINDVVSELLTTSNEYSNTPLISPIVNDIVYDIRDYLKGKNGTATLYEAFDYNREELLEEIDGEKIEGVKHNSFYDAKVIKAIYDKLHE